jgi:hypothetical protein
MFRYVDPIDQLCAAKASIFHLSSQHQSLMHVGVVRSQLWAIMLYNCNESFAVQCETRKFLNVVENIVASKSTPPVVRDRLLEVLGGATYQSIKRK